MELLAVGIVLALSALILADLGALTSPPRLVGAVVMANVGILLILIGAS